MHRTPPTAKPVFALLLTAAVLPAMLAADAPPTADTSSPRLLIAFSSYRDRPKHPQVYFYQHDGVGDGKVLGHVESKDKRSDYHPSLSLDARFCAFASEMENETSRIFMWDIAARKLVDLPAINESPNAQLYPTLAGHAKMIAFAAWQRPDAAGLWDVVLYDVLAKRTFQLPGLNANNFDERMPAFSADGKRLAFSSNQSGGAGLVDIYLYDVVHGQLVPTTNLNTPFREVEPALSANGRLIAFSSDRPGGQGGRDIYLYDRDTSKLLPLPGLNSVANEQTPSLSADGRFIAFVSERITSEGERDIFLYDRQTHRLLPTPGLNAKQEDLDPCVIVLPAGP